MCGDNTLASFCLRLFSSLKGSGSRLVDRMSDCWFGGGLEKLYRLSAEAIIIQLAKVGGLFCK